jgi:hypothetical protein
MIDNIFYLIPLKTQNKHSQTCYLTHSTFIRKLRPKLINKIDPQVGQVRRGDDPRVHDVLARGPRLQELHERFET